MFLRKLLAKAVFIIYENGLAGEVVIGRGSFEGTRTPKAGGNPVNVSGHWISVKQLQADDSWKTIEEMFNRNEPLPQE